MVVVDTARKDDPFAGPLPLKGRYRAIQCFSTLEVSQRIGICAVVSPSLDKELAAFVFIWLEPRCPIGTHDFIHGHQMYSLSINH
jgi:hypothetical protein